MRELDISKLVKEKTKTEVTQQKEQEYKVTYQGTIVPHRNHTLYEINPDTLEIKEAEYAKLEYMFQWDWTPGQCFKSHGEVLMVEGMAYVSALNKKNALKKFKKGSSGTKLDSTKIYLEL